MGFFDDLTDGLSSAVHVIATTAQAASKVANTIAAIGGVVGLQGDGDITEALHENFKAATSVLQEASLAALHAESPAAADFVPGEHSIISGIIRNKRVLKLPSTQLTNRPGIGGRLSSSTPLMYSDLLSIFTQLGIDHVGTYPPLPVPGKAATGTKKVGDSMLLDNAMAAANALFANAVVVNIEPSLTGTSDPPYDVNTFIVRSKEGHPVLKIANASYNLQIDQTGTRDISHAVISYARNSKLTAQQVKAMRQRRAAHSVDVWGPEPSLHLAEGESGTEGWVVMVRIGVRTGTLVDELAEKFSQLAKTQNWGVKSLTKAGAVIAATVLTVESPNGLQQDLIDWMCGRITGIGPDGKSLPQPPTGVVLDSLKIQDSVPALVPPALFPLAEEAASHC
ncbi:hypothetical protein QBC34DRAFT_440933 [Podospora aff. communis PSN243]|uniref:Uncharacterized protein n=1 Tax=Podospora aff. communis PSN243 TaxID=3040156 RepID=A0AAV9GFJ8_9PEZI|nr:hypothetical protein QBC34DRAFT_440933 [Podospora aff. communis PSN243]